MTEKKKSRIVCVCACVCMGFLVAIAIVSVDIVVDNFVRFSPFLPIVCVCYVDFATIVLALTA